MSEGELLEQLLTREIGNILGQFGPAFRMLAPTVTTSLLSLVDPYITAFTSPDTGKINKKAASAYLKEETAKKIDEFLKRFEDESDKL